MRAGFTDTAAVRVTVRSYPSHCSPISNSSPFTHCTVLNAWPQNPGNAITVFKRAYLQASNKCPVERNYIARRSLMANSKMMFLLRIDFFQTGVI